MDRHTWCKPYGLLEGQKHNDSKGLVWLIRAAVCSAAAVAGPIVR